MPKCNCVYRTIEKDPANWSIVFQVGNLFLQAVRTEVSRTTYVVQSWARGKSLPIPIWVKHDKPKSFTQVLWEDAGRREISYAKTQAEVLLQGETKPRRVEVLFTRLEDFIYNESDYARGGWWDSPSFIDERQAMGCSVKEIE